MSNRHRIAYGKQVDNQVENRLDRVGVEKPRFQ